MLTNKHAVLNINDKNEVVLSEKDFRKLINTHGLPIFEYEYTTGTFNYKKTFTYFNGGTICLELERTQKM